MPISTATPTAAVAAKQSQKTAPPDCPFVIGPIVLHTLLACPSLSGRRRQRLHPPHHGCEKPPPSNPSSETLNFSLAFRWHKSDESSCADHPPKGQAKR